ncbi:pentatricopeptide repeat-containing protein At2g41080-like [Selaginella moellendorffii]|uniref:pentatricopeptide repeat-containing protein At2g41080-like n=1 Tax=Selaginella moellendorffii TaxID=88036 RepID=UPI000D1CA48C|nr:pentatricopeptide repeat-containing protein At2g41080-like [Selaginella moellendorffii]|eukprot:XP_024523642.1 pentatricopeptide repeat-containing protein At2g41080-like [Selaginella moellendorffii]
MIDRGRANHLEEALEIVRSMPFQAGVVTWMTILSACRKWKNTRVGSEAFDALVGMDVRVKSSAYLLMAHVSQSDSRRLKTGNDTRSLRSVSGKKPGANVERARTEKSFQADINRFSALTDHLSSLGTMTPETEKLIFEQK